MLLIGRNQDTDSDFHIDACKSQAVAICGKRSSGMSSTVGMLIDQLFREDKAAVGGRPDGHISHYIAAQL